MPIKPKKHHITTLPNGDYVVPDVPENKRLSISIPLFYSEFLQNLNDDTAMETFRQMHCKSAIWVAMSLLHNTDLGENGCPVYFHIEDTLWHHVLPVFDEFGVPPAFMRRVVFPDAVYDEQMHHAQLGKKFGCFLDEDFDAEVQLIVDSDAFVCAKTEKLAWYRDLTSPMLQHVVGVWDFHPRHWNYAFYVNSIRIAAGIPYVECVSRGYAKAGNPWDTENMLDPIAIEKMCFEKLRLYFPFEIEANLEAWNYAVRPFVSAGYMSFPREHDIIHFLRNGTTISYHDEFLLCLWLMSHNAHPARLTEVLNMPMHIFENDYVEPSPGAGYIAHYLNAEQDTDHPAYKCFYTSLMQNMPIA